MLCLLAAFQATGQEAVLSGQIFDNFNNDAIPFASVIIQGTEQGTTSDENGKYRLKLDLKSPKTIRLQFKALGYKSLENTVRMLPGKNSTLNVKLSATSQETGQVEVEAVDVVREKISTINIDPKTVKVLPSPFGDFNKILSTLPGVVANNELSSAYSVRGGNFDENLVYVNDMEVYRPFIVRSGQQEGLSFVNPDLVQKAEFSSGGWQARYGDKLSSVLDVQYKTPKRNSGSVTAGILNQQAHLEGCSNNGRFTYVAGVRRKSAQYLFRRTFLTSGLEVSGEYFPRFVDMQSYMQYRLSGKEDSANGKITTIGWLMSYANNQYRVIPQMRETQFGTITSTLRFSVAFEGEEYLTYDTWQTALRFSHQRAPGNRSDITVSYVNTAEQERNNLEGGYRICDVQNRDPSRQDFNQCINERGVGTEFEYARNYLRADIINLLNRNYYRLNKDHNFEYGVGLSYEGMRDKLYEWNFIDSADYTRVNYFNQSRSDLKNFRYSGYAQHTYYISPSLTTTYGIRAQYFSMNKEFLLSPRWQLTYKPQDWQNDWLFRFAAGVYQQSPFYREIRAIDGSLNTGLKAQRSLHLISGSDYNFKGWGRPFKLITEVWYKAMDRVVPYDVDNVRVRYFATNSARAFAGGFDTRISGEFIQGVESWFSLGVLTTKENIDGDGRGYLRRPTDQRVTLSAFFQDHLPNNPSARIYLNMIVGTGLPFGPPGVPESRAASVAPAYRRVDIGFSKVAALPDKSSFFGRLFDTIWFGLEVLNVTGTENTISYNWVKDYSNIQYAIPNTLSARFYNLRVIGSF